MALKSCVYFIVLLNFLFIENFFSQSITWQRLYDHSPWEYGYDICEADNGNIYVVGVSEHSYGSAYILKLNPYGDTLWTRILPYGEINAVTPSGDEGCVMSGTYGSGFTVKIDKKGSVIWARLYNGPTLICTDIMRTSNGCYVVTANLYYDDGCVFKTDSSGYIIWQQFYPSLLIKNFNSIAEAHGGGYVVTGFIHDSINDTVKTLLLKIDTAGNVVWEKRYKVNNMVSTGRKIVQTSLGYLIGGRGGSLSNFEQTCFIRTDFDGNLLYAKSFYTTKNEFLHDIKFLSPNKYVISLERDSVFIPEIYNAVGMLVDSNGNILKKVKFNDHDGAGLKGILQLGNGDLVFAGDYEYSYTSNYDIYVVRTDSLLNAPPIGIKTFSNTIPDGFGLSQNYPNPFNPVTRIKFNIPYWNRRGAGVVILKVFDILGREIMILVNEQLNPATYEVTWDGTNFASGIYFYSLETKEYKETKKMTLVK